MKRRYWAAVALFSAGCGTNALEVSATTAPEEVDRTEHKLQLRLQQEFGETARVSHLVKEGERVVVGVATEGAPVDGDAVPPVGFAIYEPSSDALQVLARDTRFREARLHGKVAALVSSDGELDVVRDGQSVRLATGVRGDVAFHPAGDRALVTMMGETLADGETKVAVVDLEGKLQVIADDQGVDDRPAISPDGKTVVFVSGRTGIASFFRTDLDGGAPVQLTNVGFEPGAGPPDGFVPPPVNADILEWLDANTLRYDAGDGELWTLDIRTGAASPVGGAK